ncbi:hypothetical protein Ahy_B05g078947 isoform D [Arachis hypogaea]|uniref:YqgF/RNase H-like domain-containing protein n=1 Tax=Arachis hypogaea TaxID=3818 RepID=A0A444Z8M4_ARAHY|nr:hypothetical protein Ahy_B05g078947 isoform D [Arachis hypogaea]
MRQVKALQLFHDLVNKNEPARLLGLDVGDKYVGLALSDFQNKIASPFSVLVRKKSNIDLMASDFETLISKYSLKGFVVGLPFSCHRVSTDAGQVKVFIDALSRTKKLQGLKYTYWNESFTSKNVELLLRPLNLNNAVHSKTMLDKFAAVGILQVGSLGSSSLTVFVGFSQFDELGLFLQVGMSQISHVENCCCKGVSTKVGEGKIGFTEDQTCDINSSKF